MTKASWLRRTLSLCALFVLFASQVSWALAGTSGGISGTITDAKTGAPIAGVQLEIRSASQTITTTTDSQGHYIALSLQPDDYTLTASKEGYDTQAVSGYSVSADQTQRYDLQLTAAGTPQQ
jgi:hypothetical protein